MTSSEITQALHDRSYVAEHAFEMLAELSFYLNGQEEDAQKVGRNLLIQALEERELFKPYSAILNSLIEKAGLYPYVETQEELSNKERVNYEFHRPLGLDPEIVFHREQFDVYQDLLAGENVILSAPTSFGKSLLIDAMIATKKFKTVIIIVPTIALIDETRRRLTERFDEVFKIVTDPSQRLEEWTILVLTQERYIEFEKPPRPDFFVIDEFYKLSPVVNKDRSRTFDDRTVALNHAFFDLCKSASQFLMIGPNIQAVDAGDRNELHYKFIRTDFNTVYAQIENRRKAVGETDEDLCVRVCRMIHGQTLIYCKSPGSVLSLSSRLCNEFPETNDRELLDFADWISENYGKNWTFAKALRHGIGAHHARLPRSVSQYLLYLFDKGAIPFLLCTSTIIEGVNSSAKNIVVFENKLGKQKYDFFTFNNIKGRAGRMLRHFVGHVYLLNESPQEELTFVDIPVLSQPEDIPVTLSLLREESRGTTSGVSEKTNEQLRLLHAQQDLSIETLRQNKGVDPFDQIDVAKRIWNSNSNNVRLYSWTGIPNSEQLSNICDIVFDCFLKGTPRDGVFSARQLNYKLRTVQFGFSEGFRRGIEQILARPDESEKRKTETELVEEWLLFLRRWTDYLFPKYLSTIDRIQKEILTKQHISPGDYSTYKTMVQSWFMHPVVMKLEDYGFPAPITKRLVEQSQRRKQILDPRASLDEMFQWIQNIHLDESVVSPIERQIIQRAQEGLPRQKTLLIP